MKKILFAILCALLILPVAVSCKKEKKQAANSLKDTRWTGDFEGYAWRLSFSDDTVTLDKFYFDKIEESYNSPYTKEGKTVTFSDQLKCTVNIKMNGNSAQIQFNFTKGTIRKNQIDVTVETTILESTGDVGITEGLRTVTFTKM